MPRDEGDERDEHWQQHGAIRMGGHGGFHVGKDGTNETVGSGGDKEPRESD